MKKKHTPFIPWYFESLLSKRDEYLLGISQMFTQQAGGKVYWHNKVLTSKLNSNRINTKFT